VSPTKARRRPAAAPADGLAAELAAAIQRVPRFVRAPIFMPTERMPLPDAIAGLGRVEDLYDGDLDLTHRPRLRALKADRQARRCFIIGNGPSLARTDLTRLKSEVTFATNGFFLKMAELDWSPTFYVVEDHLVGEDRSQELNALSGTTKLFPASLAYALRPDDDTTYFDHRPRKSYPTGFDFSFDADVNTYTGGTVTFTCMQLAAYLGFQEIYLIGVDADYSIPADAALSGGGRVKEIDMRSDDPNHFHPDYFGKGKRWHEPNVEVMLGAYAEARRATESRGVSIVNATVGGKLEVFPRIDFEMLFRPEPAERLLLIDHTLMGNATATGEVKAAVLGNWPPRGLMQLYDSGHGRLRLAGGPVEVNSAGTLAEQVAAFDPDLVLYRPVPREEALHDFALELIARTNLPLALWVVDDWPYAYALEDPVPAAQLEADFRWLLARADARFSISSAMSAAFHERYGQSFAPIANGVDRADWPAASLRPAGPVKVRYAGSLAENMTFASVGLVARTIEKLAGRGIDISFEIKTQRHWHSTSTDWIDGLRHTRVSTSDLTITEYRRWLTEADILLLAYNFDARSRSYIRYSLANKLPECLASGAAVLAVGPDDVATIATMAALGVAELVTLPDGELIGETLTRLAASPEARFENAQRAQAIAFSIFDVHQAQQALEAGVSRVAAAHRAGEYPRDVHAHVDETAVIASMLDERRGVGHVMLDVGAHTGSSTAHFDRLGWMVHCFEPHPASRESLAARFASHENVRIDPRALGDAPATNVPLYESPESSGIAALNPFHPSHRAAAQVDVTTVTEVVQELGLSSVDFLKIDVEGLDLAVLRGVPWGDLRPDVVECEFEDAKTLALGHSWQDIGAFLRDQGYTVYVSEWHPVIRYGARHDWRRVVPFGDDPDVDPAAWGNLLAFRDDPGWSALRRAFNAHIERGTERHVGRPVRARSTNGAGAHELEQSKGARSSGARTGKGRGAAMAPGPRPYYAAFGQWLKPRAPTVYRLLRLTRRAVAGLWRRRRWTIPVVVALAAWTLLGFVPAMAPFSWHVWGSAALSVITLVMLYATYRLYELTRTMRTTVARLRQSQSVNQKWFSEASAKIGRLERALEDTASTNADLRRKIGRLEQSIEERRAAAAKDRHRG
jgi:FkbM family methyltransferase